MCFVVKLVNVNMRISTYQKVFDERKRRVAACGTRQARVEFLARAKAGEFAQEPVAPRRKEMEATPCKVLFYSFGIVAAN
jgi:hypothetical protein